MKEQNPGQQKHPHIPEEEVKGRPNRVDEGGGTRQYESGRNPDMQVQRSDRQGSGQPTQQRPEDR
jgi:hypothetical protein